MSILIVEDEDPIRSVLTEILEDEGYRVASVRNGLEALTYLRQHAHPRLILLDLGMPVMTGWEFREEQQRDQAIARIPGSSRVAVKCTRCSRDVPGTEATIASHIEGQTLEQPSTISHSVTATFQHLELGV